MCTSWQIRMHVRLGGLTIQTGSDDLDNTLNRGSEIEEKKRIKEEWVLRIRKRTWAKHKSGKWKKSYTGARRSIIKIRVREKTRHNRSIREWWGRKNVVSKEGRKIISGRTATCCCFWPFHSFSWVSSRLASSSSAYTWGLHLWLMTREGRATVLCIN